MRLRSFGAFVDFCVALFGMTEQRQMHPQRAPASAGAIMLFFIRLFLEMAFMDAVADAVRMQMWWPFPRYQQDTMRVECSTLLVALVLIFLLRLPVPILLLLGVVGWYALDQERLRKEREACRKELVSAMPSRFFGATDIPRLEQAVTEARRLGINAIQAETALQDALLREGQRQAKALEQATETKRRAAERELWRAMPGWISCTDLSRLERAIATAASLGVDVHDAQLALDKERSARKGECVYPGPRSATNVQAMRPPSRSHQFSDEHLKEALAHMVKLHRAGDASELKTMITSASQLGVTVDLASGAWRDENGRHGSLDPFTVDVPMGLPAGSVPVVMGTPVRPVD